MIEDLRDRLERLGLSQYLDAFVAEGFDSWETVVDITESDLTALNVKLGHRRKLQRAIVESTGRSIAPLVPDPRKGTIADESYRSDDSAAESRSSGKRTGDPSSHAGTTTKRKYRRHPKPDDNAPERPPSAYVIFSNHVRETLKGQNHSFTEIAKIVGERWQVLSPSDRESCERQANFAKEKYGVALAEYKKTAEYGSYQEYLAEFKAK
ncbi:HMG-box, partial [Eremomyces bilateralis CBS 781.70]